MDYIKRAMIIGITGTISSGKETVAEYLNRKGIAHFSLSDELREIAKERNLAPMRDNLVNLGNEFRKKYGPGYLAKRVLKKIRKNAAVSSIRNLGEIEELKKQGNFILISVDALPKIRFERAKKRNRLGDAKNLKEFIQKEQREKKKSKFGQQLSLCIKAGDYKIENNGTKEELYGKIEEIFKKASLLG